MQSSSPWVWKRRLVLGGLLVAAIVAGAGTLLLPIGGPQGGLPLPASTIGPGTGASSERRVEVAFHQSRLYGTLAFDDVTPLNSPAFAPARESLLHDDTLIVGVALGGEAKAYPITVLEHHEMVNDIVGGVPVLVTWCPACGTALVHDRRIDGSARTFGNYSALYENAMTWYDDETRSLWWQPSGVALSGSLAGVRLEMLPARVATWAGWKRDRPGPPVLAEGHGCARRASVSSLAEHPWAFVVGVAVAGAVKAYPLDAIGRDAINDRVGDVPVLVYVGPGGTSVYVFDRRVAGSALEFEWVGERLRDRETGSLWDPSTGAAVEGAHKGAVLSELPYGTAYRWAWEEFYPGADLYGS